MDYAKVYQAKQKAEHFLEELIWQEKDLSSQVNSHPENEELKCQLKRKQESIKIVESRIERAKEKIRNMEQSIENEEVFEDSL
jgi:hypothetical protein